MMTRSPARLFRKVSLCSSLAIATSLVMGASPAAAQFVGTIDPGSTGIGAGSTNSNLIITGQQAVINWTATNTPNAGEIAFLPEGNGATFNGSSNFAVLNRVTPGTAGNAISIGGSITSLIGGEIIGGTVYFYSPNGIVIGANASINVGSLGLTTSPIADDGQGNWMTDFGTASPSVTFGAANPGSYVRTRAAIDGSINASGFASYVAMVAPIVQHGGIIRTDSGAALVAAESAKITFNQSGLYDIEVTAGTDALQPLTVNGGTITRNSQTIGGDRHAYLVAVPKNDAITLLVVGGAQLGFDIAGSAGVEGNTVVLSAGRDIASGSASGEPVSTANADVTIDNAAISSNLFADASNIVQITTWNGATTFTGDIDVHADTLVAIQSTANALTVGGDVFADADHAASGEGEDALAGEVRLGAHSGTTISITGDAHLSAVAEGGFSNSVGTASGSAQGGVVSAYAVDGGTLSIGGTLSADASGIGGGFFTEVGFIDGGNGLGGTVDVTSSGGSTMTVTGAAALTANGTAGQGFDCFQCGGVGGIGDAGSVTVQAHTGPLNTMTFGNGLTIDADGRGGTGLSGGLGDGGNVIVVSRGQSSLTVTGDLSVSVTGRGGNATGVSGIVGDGGDGLGGESDVSADNGSLNITGSFDTLLNGSGGDSNVGNGGYGEGGLGELFAWNGGTAAIGTYAQIFANGNGGGGLTGGGEGQGGRAYFSSSSGATLTLGSFSMLVADGRGGDAFNTDNGGFGNGGLGEGGHVEAYANGATLTVQDTLVMSADGHGGNAGDGMTAGDSQGGDVYLQAVNDGDFSVAGGLYATAVGIGAYFNSSATISGNGTGGTINIYSRDGNSTLTISGTADLNADGAANAQGECFPCGGIGGIGQGGDIIIASQGATGVDGNLLTFGNALTATANGFGGGGIGGAAGDGRGGDVLLNAADGNRTNVAGNVRLEARGSGGFDDVGLAGGDGTGGLARITTFGTGPSLMTLGANAVVDASGLGGDSELSLGGTGGNGQSGSARVAANGGSIAITGNLTLQSISSGGSGDNGGDGIAVVGTNPQNTATSDARLLAYGGSVSVTGTTTLDVRAEGGSGANGGSGGDASGGYAVIHARNSNVGPSTITLGTVIVDADAAGGAGGTGISDTAGTSGGNGGAAAGGIIVVTAAAGNGHLSTGNLALSASATGGAGGDGGTGFDGPGGDGGDGGDATQGGAIFVGSETGLGEATANNTGTANFGNVFAFADAIGGNGGFANSGFPGGTGGNGGSGDGGLAVFQTRGALVTAGAVGLSANGTGGDGGGSETGIGGIGGDGVAGEVKIIATSRFLTPVQRGTLNANAIFANAIGTGGSGSTAGASVVEGDSVFQVANADANIGSVDIVVDGDTVAPGSDPSQISVINGAVNITGGGGFFSFQTIGELSLYLANAGLATSLTTGVIILTAGDFVADTNNPITNSPGTIFANSAFITTGNNFIADANIDTVNDLVITAPGSIQFDQAISDNGVILWAQGGSIVIEGVDAGAAVNLLAATSVGTDDINAGATVTIEAQGGSIGTGHIVAGGDVSLIGVTLVEGDDITTSGNVFVQSASGNVDFQNLAGFDVTLDSGDSILITGNIDATGDVDFVAINAITAVDVLAGGFIEATAGGPITLGNLSAGGNVLVNSTSGPVSIGDITGAAIALNSGGDMAFGNATAQLGSVEASAVGSMSFLDIIAATFVTIDPTDIVGGDVTALAGDVDMTGDSIAIGNVSASDNVFLTALAGDLSTGTIDAGIDVILDASGDVTTSHITAGGLIDATGASLTLGNLNANSISLTTTVADLTVGNVTIPGALALTTAGDLVFGDLSASDVDLAATESITGGAIDSGTDVTAVAGTSLDVGTINADGDVALDAGDDLSFGDLNAFVVNLTAGGAIDGGNIDSDTDITAVAGTGITFLDLEAGGFDDTEGFWNGSIDLTAGGGITTGTLLAFGAIDMTANGGALQFGDANALFGLDGSATGSILGGNIIAADIDLTGNGVTTGNVSSDNDVIVISTASIQTGDIDALSGVELDATGSILAGDITAATIDLFAGGDITTGDLTTQFLDRFSDGFIALLFPGASITLEAGGNIATGAINSIDGVYANAGGGIATGTIDAVDFVQLLAGGNVSTGYIFAGSYIDIFSSGGGIATGDLTGTEIDLEADGDISFANVDADVLDFEATGAVDGGDISASSAVLGEAGGAVTLGDISVGPGLPPVDDFSVGIASATSITVGDVSGTDRVGFATLGDLTTGDLSASDLIMTLVGGDINVGTMTTTAPNGQIYMADAQMYLDAGGSQDDFDASLVLSQEPLPTGGSITINGSVSTNMFRAAAGTGLTSGAITAQTIEASAGGTATLNGLWSADSVTLASNDIDIGAVGGITGASTGIVTLISTNGTQALIGDGLTGSGYALSNAEFGRIEGGSVYILARGDASAAQDMLIGDLTVTGPLAGSTIESADGILVFATGDIDSETPGGVIRVVGDLVATGFGGGNAIEFYADLFELDAATGGISITSSGGALAGELGLYAEQIHVAEGSILDQLAVNPQYAGYQDDLNAPATVQRPEGVLNAATIWIESDNLQNILIQNMGTDEIQAGFLAQEIFVNDDEEIAGLPGSIDVVVNGQLQTEGGTLIGIAVRDALVEGEDLTPFTSNSTINGCELVGDCSGGGGGDGPIFPLPTEFSLIIDTGLPELPFDGDETSSAIQPPPALFDTRPLDPDATVDEPISGSGNPALIGSGPTAEICAAAGTEANPQCAPVTNTGDQQ